MSAYRHANLFDIGDLQSLEAQNLTRLASNFSADHGVDAEQSAEYMNAYSLGIQAYIYSFPWLYLSQLRWLWTTEAGAAVLEAQGFEEGGYPHAPINSFWCSSKLASPRPDGNGTGGSPNTDTLYSVAWCDLSREPMVISVPAVSDRYYTIELTNIDSDTYGYVGVRTTGRNAGHYLLAGPGWKGQLCQSDRKPLIQDVLPRAIYPTVLLLGRTGVNDYSEEEISKALNIQSQYTLTPLSAWQGRRRVSHPDPPNAQVPIGFSYSNPMGAWLTINRAMTENPPGVWPGIMQDQILRVFEQIGIGPNQELAAQSPVTLLALQNAAKKGLDIMKGANKTTLVNGWRYPPAYMGKAGQVGDYLTRAKLQAMSGITANFCVEGVYLNTDTDSAGETLLAGNKYTVTFTTQDILPFDSSKNGFWSITTYDFSYNLVAGSEHYTVNSWAPDYAARDATGGLTIYLQEEDPGVSEEAGSYWLQTPAVDAANGATFFLILRVYMPSPEVAGTQTYHPPAVVKVNGSAEDSNQCAAKEDWVLL